MIGIVVIRYLELVALNRRQFWTRYLNGGKIHLVGTMRSGIWITVSLLLLVFCCTTSFGSKAETGEKVFAGWILHMFISGQLKEYTPRGGMAECLKVKRKILRSHGHSVGTRWECAKGKLVLRKYDTGKTGDKWLPVEHLGKQ
jgi:hypothetical protein